ncbi:carboxylesterase [Acanthamoeba castellanii str. Neff]|uniref:Carboxylic ester hydrolase n=1 Tax=Acanthamoeba castellanii (strain ATCC 30010 / Neff) TaxID=1257118 RepID=L8HHI6_ACACF|nr:carboxylesterase [Acanthamoeba castellanii str. Neff]ELR23916.1 carboxylesterase [Acanthamoeba castellanii str. Neff]
MMVGKSRWTVLVLLLVVVALTACSYAQTVETECGPVRGVVNEASGVAAFLGLPYAQPPVKHLRWQPAQALSRDLGCWKGLRVASAFGKACPQQYMPASVMSEDCLVLNVWTPNRTLHSSSSEKLPVMVFFHGGSYVMGSGHFDGSRFVNKSDHQVVLVSINYRLNGFGFMALDELSRHDSRGVSGNYGVTDMIASLEWVRKNIASFGGDPNLVTIFGQSSGGTAALMLLTAPSAKGLFHRAILESASTRVDMSLADANAQNRVFVKKAKCDGAADVYGCLLSLSTDQILEAIPWDEYPYYNHPTDMDIPIFEKGPGAMLGIVDGVTIPLPVDQALMAGLFNDVPTIIGTNEQEIDFAPAAHLENYTIPEFQDYIRKRYEVATAYNGLPQKAYDSIGADIHATCGQLLLAKNAGMGFKSPVFHYSFGQDPSHPFCLMPDWCAKYALHALEMFMLFDDYSAYMPTDYVPNAVDNKMGDIMRHFWLYFAKHGDTPSNDGFAKWWPINGNNVRWPEDYNTYRLTVKPTAHRGWKRQECEFWNANGFYAFNWNS